MGFRYRKSINLGLGFRVNFSKSGIGYSWGIPGHRITKTADGKIRETYSIIGTGISYVDEKKLGTKQTSSTPPQLQKNTHQPAATQPVIETTWKESARSEEQRHEEKERHRREEEARRIREELRRKAEEARKVCEEEVRRIRLEEERKPCEEEERRRRERLEAAQREYDQLKEDITFQLQIINQNQGWFGSAARIRKAAQEHLGVLQARLEKDFPAGRP